MKQPEVAQPTPGTDGLAKAARAAGAKGPPPVHLWNPPFCGDIAMHIARDGTWFYEGTPIGREALVRLFASILRRDGNDYFLVTPVEKVGITVADAPFIAIDFERQGHDLLFTTNVGDRCTAGEANPIRVVLDADSGEPTPYVHVRRGLEARIDRKSFYRLVEMGEVEEVDGSEWFGVRSGGIFFPIQRADALDL